MSRDQSNYFYNQSKVMVAALNLYDFFCKFAKMFTEMFYCFSASFYL